MAGIAWKLVTFFVLLASAESSTCPKAGCDTCIPGETCAKKLMALPQDASSFIQTRIALNSHKQRGDDPEADHPEVSQAAQAEAEASRAEEGDGEGEGETQLHVNIQSENSLELVDFKPDDEIYKRVGEALSVDPYNEDQVEITYSGELIPRRATNIEDEGIAYPNDVFPHSATFAEYGIEDAGKLGVHRVVLKVVLVYFGPPGSDPKDWQSRLCYLPLADCAGTVEVLQEAIKIATGSDSALIESINWHDVEDARKGSQVSDFVPPDHKLFVHIQVGGQQP